MSLARIGDFLRDMRIFRWAGSRTKLSDRTHGLEKIALKAVTILAFFSFGLAALLPVYTDEIVWKVAHGRLGFDGFQVPKLSLSCAADAVSLPASIVPIRVIDTLMYQWISGPLAIRVMGMVFFLLWLSGTWVLLQRLVPPIADKWTIAGSLVAFVMLGVMPFLMVISRPEQWLLMGITVLLIICMEERNPTYRSLSYEITMATLFVFGSAVILAAHPRAIFVLPLMVTATLKAFNRRTTVCIITVLLIYLCATYYDFWAEEVSCQDPYYQRHLEPYSIMLAASSGHISEYLAKLTDLIVHDPGHFLFVSSFGFYSPHTSGIIPTYPWPWITLPLTLAIAAFVGATSACGFCAFVIIVIETLRQRHVSIKVSALASVWGLLFISLFVRAQRQDYEVTLIEPLLGLVTILSIWAAREQLGHWLGTSRFQRLSRSALRTLLLLSIVSQIALLSGYFHNAVKSWITPGYPKDQHWSVANFGYESLRAKILETAAMCGINPKNHPHHLVVDEVTYFALREAHQPFFTLFLDENNWGAGIHDIRALLTQQRSAGIIVGCQWIPSKLRGEAVVNGDFCCVPSFAS